jgi:Uma2 family endonuclease
MATEVTSNDVPQLLPPELRPDVSQLVTEVETPVDNIFSEKQQRLLTEPLYSSWRDPASRRTFLALANVGLFYSIHQPPYAPDMLLSLDVSVPADLFPKSHRSYFVWEYGKPPDVVIEIVSNRVGGEGTEKVAGYARIGVTYYAIFDPERWLSNDVLRVFERHGTSYRPMTGPTWFSDVNLGLQLWHGSYEGYTGEWLRWFDSEGKSIPTGAERAEQERARADKLAEQLKRLGVEPEA